MFHYNRIGYLVVNYCVAVILSQSTYVGSGQPPVSTTVRIADIASTPSYEQSPSHQYTFIKSYAYTMTHILPSPTHTTSSHDSSIGSLYIPTIYLPSSLMYASFVASAPSSPRGWSWQHWNTGSIFVESSSFAVTSKQPHSSVPTPSIEWASSSTSADVHLPLTLSASSDFASSSQAPLIVASLHSMTGATTPNDIYSIIKSSISTVSPSTTCDTASTQCFSVTSQSSFTTNMISNTIFVHGSSLILTPTPAVKTISSLNQPTNQSSKLNFRHSSSPVLAATASTNDVTSIPVPMLRPISVPTPMPASVYPTYPTENVRCSNTLQIFSARIEFDESTAAGTVLAASKVTANVTLSVSVVRPPTLAQVLSDYFNISTESGEFRLVLAKKIDVEDVYMKTGRLVPIRDFVLQIECSEIHTQGPKAPPTVTNVQVTVRDVDDNLPRFVYQGSGTTCVVPVYNAHASEDFTGELEITPGRIYAVDGDLVSNHNISYRVMHAEPENYDVYFNVDVTSGSVNKTKTMNNSDPRKFVIFVQAVEDSPQQKKRVAVLSIEVFAPTDTLTDPDTAVNPTVKLCLQVASVIVILGFTAGFIVILHHRNLRKRRHVDPRNLAPREIKLPPLAFSEKSCTLDTETSTWPNDDSDIEQITIASPSLVDVKRKQSVTSRHTIKVKRPLDVTARPAWNATSAKARRMEYSPYRKH